MRLKMKQPVLDYEGKPILVNKANADGSPVLGKDNRPVQEPETLRSYLVISLNNKAQTETEPIGAEDAAKRYQLSTKLYAKNEVELTSKEVVLLLDRVGIIFVDSPLIRGRISDVLEEREPELPEGVEDDEVIAKNLDLTNAEPKDPSKPAVQPNKPAKKADGGE
jgi:hypothetical protein